MAQTRWGDVQVTITVTNGKITDVAVPVYPNGNGRDQEINAYALPILRQETLPAQSATSTPSPAPPSPATATCSRCSPPSTPPTSPDRPPVRRPVA